MWSKLRHKCRSELPANVEKCDSCKGMRESKKGNGEREEERVEWEKSRGSMVMIVR